MSEPSYFVAPVLEGPPAALVESRSRTALLKRLTDVVCLPASRIKHFERAMTADFLVEMLPRPVSRRAAALLAGWRRSANCPAP